MTSNPTQVLQAEIARLREENERLQNELYNLRQFVQALQALSQAEAAYHSHADLLRLLDEIGRLTLDLLSAPDGSLLLLDPETGELEFVIVYGVARDLTGTRLQPGEGIAGWVAAEGKPCIVPDVRVDPRFSARIDQLTHFQTKSIAAAPLIGNGHILGVVEVLNRPEDDPFDALDQALLALFCRFAGEALANIEQATREAELLEPPDYGLEPEGGAQGLR